MEHWWPGVSEVLLSFYTHASERVGEFWVIWWLFTYEEPLSSLPCFYSRQHLLMSLPTLGIFSFEFFVLGDGMLTIQPRSGQVLHPRSFISISSYGLWWIFLINDWRGRAQLSGWWPRLLKESRLSKPNGSKQVSSTVCCFCSSSCLRKTEPQMGSEYKEQPGKEMRGIPASMESCGGFMCSKGHWKDMEDPVIWWNYKASLVATRNQQSIFFLRQDFSL